MEGGEAGFMESQGDPANLEFSPDGVAQPADTDTGAPTDATGTKIDYSTYAPVPFQKTATLVNYFITNSAQFLNA